MRLLHIGFDNPSMSKALMSQFDEYKFMNWTEWTSIPGNIQKLHDDTQKIAVEYGPDVILMQIQNGGVYTGDVLSRLPGKVINWTWDVRVPTPDWVYDMGSGSISAFTNEYDVNNLRARGLRAEFVQSGFNSEVFRPDGSIGEYPDIVFIGNNYKNQDMEFALTDYRIQTVDFLRDTYKNKFGVYGLGWGNIFNQFMYKENKEAECYRSCKIAINLSHYTLDRYTSDRMLRLMGSGAFCLSRWYPGIEKDFQDGVHLRIWHEHDDLVELIAYYDEHEEERRHIAKTGCEHVHNNFKWDNFAKNIKEL